MSERKARRETSKKEKQEISKKAKTKLILMFISIAFMVFCIFQVYFLVRYTLGYDVSSKNMRVYKWVTLLVNGSGEETN